MRLPNGRESREWSEQFATYNDGVSIVQQHFKEDVDVNTIVRRFGITGEMPFGASGGVYGDFTEVTDFESARARILRAEEGFLRLPAEVRERFGNDPGAIVRFAQERSEAEFIEAMRGEPEAATTPVVSTTPAPGGAG